MTEAYNVEQSINNSSINLGHPKKNVSFPIARMTHFFSKSKKKSDALVKEASTLIFKHTILFY